LQLRLILNSFKKDTFVPAEVKDLLKLRLILNKSPQTLPC